MQVKTRFQYDPGLRLYLPLYQLDGNTIMSRDAYGHLCTVTVASLYPGRGRYFDGVDDEIDCGNHPALDFTAGSFTVVAWINQTGSPFDNGYLIKRGTYQINGRYLWYHNASETLQFYTNQGGAAQATTVDMIFDRFLFMVLVRDGATATFYRDCEDRTASHGTHIDPVTCNDALKIGASSNDDWKGIIGEIAVYSRALAPQEIQRIYHATKWRYG